MNASTGRLREAFLETHEDWIDDLQQMNEAPADWLTGYNGFRPHRSLNMTTPLTRFYSSINDHLGAAIQNLDFLIGGVIMPCRTNLLRTGERKP